MLRDEQMVIFFVMSACLFHSLSLPLSSIFSFFLSNPPRLSLTLPHTISLCLSLLPSLSLPLPISLPPPSYLPSPSLSLFLPLPISSFLPISLHLPISPSPPLGANNPGQPQWNQNQMPAFSPPTTAYVPPAVADPLTAYASQVLYCTLCILQGWCVFV